MKPATFTLTYPQFKQAVKAAEPGGMNSPLATAVVMLTLAGGLAIASYLVVFRRMGAPSPSLASHLSDTIVGLLIATFVFWRAMEFFDGRFRRRWMKLKPLHGPQSVELVGDSLRFSTGAGQRVTPIASYSRVVETRDLLVLIASGGVDVIPKRVLDAPTLDRLRGAGVRS